MVLPVCLYRVFRFSAVFFVSLKMMVILNLPASHKFEFIFRKINIDELKYILYYRILLKLFSVIVILQHSYFTSQLFNITFILHNSCFTQQLFYTRVILHTKL